MPPQKISHKKVFAVVLGLLVLAGLIFYIVKNLPPDSAKALVVSQTVFSTNTKGERVVSGVLENKTKKETFSDIVVDIEFLDEAGASVGKRFVFTNSLGPQQTWKFESTVVPANTASFSTTVTTGALD
jgi:hypothetical protein